MQGQPASDARVFRKYEFHRMKMTIRSEEFARARKNAVRVGCVNVVKKTVHENEVVGTGRNGVGSCGIRDKKIAMIPVSRQLNITFIDVDSQVFGMSEARRVRSRPASDIQDGSYLFQVVVPENAGKFLSAKKQLRKIKHKWLFEQVMEHFH